jgi:hypothetical protein
MLVPVKLAADSSKGRAHPDTRGLISTTHPLTIRELISASPSKGARGSQYSAPFARSGR